MITRMVCHSNNVTAVTCFLNKVQEQGLIRGMAIMHINE